MNGIVFILLDTNVVLDFALRRDEHYENAKRLFAMMAEDRVIAHLSASPVTDVYYFIRKKHPHDVAMNMLAALVEAIRIIRVDERTIEKAFRLPMDDFEDVVQTAAAADFDLEFVVTRDETGFVDSGLQVYTPEKFLATLK